MKARVNTTKKTETHAPNKAREIWNDTGEINKGPTTGNGVGASSLEIRTGNLSKSVTMWTDTVFEPKLNAQQCAICEAFFSKCFEQSTSWCFGSHFFAARSHRFIATCHCRLLASFLKGKAWKENSFVKFSLQPTAAHSLGMLKNLPDYFRFNFV